MEKISISNIIEFRRRSPNSQITFVNNLNRTKPESKPEGGGDYWIHSLSAISSVFKTEQNELLDEKVEILRGKHKNSSAKISKDMFQRNIKILTDFENFNFLKFKPNRKIEYLPKPQDKSIMIIRGIPIQVLPHHVFSFEDKGIKKIGAIWFVAKLEGYANGELAIFTDALHRYLKQNYSKEFDVSSDFCVAVDVMNLNDVRYTKILSKEISSLLNSTLDSIKKILDS